MFSAGDRRPGLAIPVAGMGKCLARAALGPGLRRSGNLRPARHLRADRRLSHFALDGRSLFHEASATGGARGAARGPIARLGPALGAPRRCPADRAQLVAYGAGARRGFAGQARGELSGRAVKFSIVAELVRVPPRTASVDRILTNSSTGTRLRLAAKRARRA